MYILYIAPKQQNHIMFCFAIYLDSWVYWHENLDSWCEKYGLTYEDIIGDQSLTRCPPIPRPEREWLAAVAQNEEAIADVWGAVWAGATGLIPGIGWGGVCGTAVLSEAVGGSIGSALGF